LVKSARAGIHARPLHEARGHQPSLCYVLTALATLTDGVRDAQELCRPNPHYLHCWPGYPFQAQGAAAGHGRRLHGYMDHPGRQRAEGDLDRAVLSLAGASPYLSSGLGAAASCVPIHFATMPFKWESRVYVTRDYTVPVDVCREDGDITAQGDSQPMHNRLATSLWSESDMVRDEHVIQSSPGPTEARYSNAIARGHFDPSTMGRLPDFECDQRLPNAAAVERCIAVWPSAEDEEDEIYWALVEAGEAAGSLARENGK
jgi:hypothetical protein